MLLFFFGLGMCGFSLYMVFKPYAFANQIAVFASKPWFHWFEVISRLLIGLLFFVFAERTNIPNIFSFLGWLLCGVSIFLVLIGQERHRQFAFFTSTLGRFFRPIGGVAMGLGAVLCYLGAKSIVV